MGVGSGLGLQVVIRAAHSECRFKRAALRASLLPNNSSYGRRRVTILTAARDDSSGEPRGRHHSRSQGDRGESKHLHDKEQAIRIGDCLGYSPKRGKVQESARRRRARIPPSNSHNGREKYSDWEDIERIVQVSIRKRLALKKDILKGPLRPRNAEDGASQAHEDADIAMMMTTRVQRINHAIRELGRLRDLDAVETLFQWTCARRPRDVSDHTRAAFFKALSDNNNGARALREFEKIRNSAIEIGPICASAIIDACGRDLSMSLDKCLDILAGMHARGVALNIRTYNAALQACAIRAEGAEALSLYNLIRTQRMVDGLTPTTFTYGAVLRALDASNLHRCAPAIFADMESDVLSGRLEPDVHLFQHALHIASVLEDVAFGERVIRVMSGCAIPKNLHVYNAGIALYGRAKMFDKAMEWFGRLKRDPELRGPDNVTATTILHAASLAEIPLKDLEDLIEDLFERCGVRRTQRNNGAVLGALRWASGAEKGETVKRSLAWLNGMVERGEVVEAQHCHTVGILMLEEEDFEGVIRLFHAYVEDLGVQPTIALLRLVVEAWEGIGDEEKADEFRVLQRTYERLQAPDL